MHRLPDPGGRPMTNVGTGNPDMVWVMSGCVREFLGILLSLIYLFPATTPQYFKASLRDVYKIMLVPAAVVWAAALLVLVVFRVIL